MQRLFTIFMAILLSITPVFAAKNDTATTQQEVQEVTEEEEGQPGHTAYYMNDFSQVDELTTVTFQVDMQEGINAPCYLFMTNAETYQEYWIDLYASNDYTQTVKMPQGNYYFQIHK